MGERAHSTNWTSGANFAAILSCPLPVKIAEGMISPKRRTRVTDMITASQEGTIWSRKSGRASLASEFMRRRVTNSRWWSLISGRTLYAANWSSFSFCLSNSSIMSFSSVFTMISISMGSIETMPIVRPAASAAMSTQKNANTQFLMNVWLQGRAMCSSHGGQIGPEASCGDSSNHATLPLASAPPRAESARRPSSSATRAASLEASARQAAKVERSCTEGSPKAAAGPRSSSSSGSRIAAADSAGGAMSWRGALAPRRLIPTT
mmetsp:Transcript_73436/g.192576  ORF Transcript_73436/g.192576 Transcript_73436/m.192576 type:complete len:264 (+) Transcript_73436:1322-2113(+)